MIKKTITYTDFNEIERTEDFHFHLSNAELVEMEKSVKGGMAQMLETIIATDDEPTIIAIFKDIILKSYGVKSPDGKQFIKSKEVVDAFVFSEAYSVLYMELVQDTKAAINFVNGIIPKSLRAETIKEKM